MSIRDTLAVLEADGADFHRFIKGAAEDTVNIDGGTVPTLGGLVNRALLSVKDAVTLSTVSATPITLATGVQTFTIEAGKNFVPGQWLTATHDAQNSMAGVVVSQTGTTLVLDVSQVLGSGSYTAWTIAVSGLPGTNTVENGGGGTPTSSPKLITKMPWE